MPLPRVKLACVLFSSASRMASLVAFPSDLSRMSYSPLKVNMRLLYHVAAGLSTHSHKIIMPAYALPLYTLHALHG